MTQTGNTTLRRVATAMFGIALAAMLTACAMSDDTVSSFLVAPGKYVLYKCDDIARTAKATQARQKELEQLMAKAGTDHRRADDRQRHLWDGLRHRRAAR